MTLGGCQNLATVGKYCIHFYGGNLTLFATVFRQGLEYDDIIIMYMLLVQ